MRPEYIINADHNPTNRTKGEIAQLIYQDCTYDHALPQPWVDAMYDRGYDVVPHFVWIYPDSHPWGIPGPITTQGIAMLAQASM